jgi:hypothetical protein
MTMHFFEVEEAIKYGVESAILLSNIRFWLTKNKANQSHSHDGYYWTYNSAAAFVELFPYMTKQSIARYLKNLCDAGVLKSGNYNEIKYDRKLWYTIPAEFAVKSPEALNLAISQNETCTSQNESSTPQNEKSISHFETPISQNESPIADINTDSKPDINTDAAVGSPLSEEQQKCFEWAKTEKYWSSRVYSEEAFLKRYNAKSGALKGQYANHLAMQKQETEKNAPKKSAPARPTWQLQGFNSEEDYNAAHLQKLKQMEANAKGGRAMQG